MKKSKVYDYVTERIIAELEKGVIPWRRPWAGASHAMNYITRKPYRGINAILLPAGEYLTFKQVQDLGGKVKKGAKANLAVFWKLHETTEQTEVEEATVKTWPVLRYYNVFHLTDIEGIPSKLQTWEHDPVEQAETIMAGYNNGPQIEFVDTSKAYYQPVTDRINLPPRETFPRVAAFYSTMFHEMVHSTGHDTRLGRLQTDSLAAFGNETYSQEELVAELGASMLCAVAGLDNDTISDSANYIGGWLQRLRNDTTLIVTAASQAQKAVDWILGE